MSEQTYLADSTQWGNYSYVTLEQVVIDYMASLDSDDYTYNVDRYKVVYQAKQGLRELCYDVLREIKAIELDLGSTLQVVLPPDYVDYVRLSWSDHKGNLYPLAENRNLSISKVYLQDNNYNILFDGSGNILESSTPKDPVGDTNERLNFYDFCVSDFSPNVNRAEVYGNGSYRIDKDAGVIRFSSDVESRSIVMEYISDGLYFDTNKGETETSIRVPKYAQQALLDRIYYYLIKNRRNVPYNEKVRARKEYYNSNRVAKRRINAANKEELVQAMKGSSVWIKESNDRSY